MEGKVAMLRIACPYAVSTMLAFPWSAWSGTEAEDRPLSWSESGRVFAAFDTPASEQLPGEGDLPSPARPYGYGNFAGGSCNHGFTVIGGGGGGEAFPHPRLGLGGDLGYYQFVDDVSFALFAFNAAFHFGDRSGASRFDPYLSVSPGVYTVPDEGGGGAFGFGGGFNLWFADRVGLHTDVRLAALGTEEGIFLFRLGVAFR
jgi:hypothetical protein